MRLLLHRTPHLPTAKYRNMEVFEGFDFDGVSVGHGQDRLVTGFRKVRRQLAGAVFCLHRHSVALSAQSSRRPVQVPWCSRDTNARATYGAMFQNRGREQSFVSRQARLASRETVCGNFKIPPAVKVA